MKIHKSIILKIGFYSLLVITLLNLTYFFYEYKVLTLMKNIVTQKMTKTDETSGYYIIRTIEQHSFYSFNNKTVLSGKDIDEDVITILLLSHNDCMSCIRNFESKLRKKLEQFDQKPYIIAFENNFDFILRITKKFKIESSDLLIDKDMVFQSVIEQYGTPLILRIDRKENTIKAYYIK